jgi:hypothetical protein
MADAPLPHLPSGFGQACSAITHAIADSPLRRAPADRDRRRASARRRAARCACHAPAPTVPSAIPAEGVKRYGMTRAKR